jgi:predicted dehydrogenase
VDEILDSKKQTIRFGVLGTGRITRRLVADLQSTPDVSVEVIGSRSRERAEWFASQYGIANPVEGYENVLLRDDLDAIYIALPPSLHAEWCVRAAEQGKTLLCEKPLAVNSAQALEIVQACQQHRVRWLDATGWLHHRRTQEMLSWASSGRLGKLCHLTSAVSFYRPFQSDEHRLDADLGGGCLLDLGWYAAGLSCRFTERTPRRVFADWIVERQVPIRVTASMWFEDDITATFSCGYDTATRKWFEVAGSEASVICDDFTRPWADRKTRFWVHQADGSVESLEYSDRQEQRMIETLVGDQPLESYQSQAFRTQVVLDALKQSAESGLPVDVPAHPTL